ncbi:MAG: formate dehydrogenase accessory sulfurtransferase FdhD [Nitrospiria bacterium]
MANKIGEFFEAFPDRDEALLGIANHLQKFWEPRMLSQLLDYLAAESGKDLTPIVLSAIRTHRDKLSSQRKIFNNVLPDAQSIENAVSTTGRKITTIPVLKMIGDSLSSEEDILAVEEPLQIRLNYANKGVIRERNIAITMRTPGNDFELAAGFLFTEGILQNGNQVVEIQHTGPKDNIRQHYNTITIRLKPDPEINLERLKRNFYVSSSCGICGKTSIEGLKDLQYPSLPESQPRVEASVIHRIPEVLRKSQAIFNRTGGLHAAALFTSLGELVGLQEDVGRHNAVDKLIGKEFLKNRIPLSDYILMVSGRSSFELAQKALIAGIPILAAVGAPSSLSVELSLRFQMTLLGFVRNDRFNIYSGSSRIVEKNNRTKVHSQTV